jgi:hypothetical protein
VSEEDEMFNVTFVKRSLAAGLAIGVAAVPAAAQAQINRDVAGGATPAAVTAAAQQPAHSTQSSFDWGDAGIGAGGVIVLLGAGAATSGAMRRRRAVRAA